MKQTGIPFILKETILQIVWFLFFASAFSCFVRIPQKAIVDVLTSSFLVFLILHYLNEWQRSIRTGKIRMITLIMLPFILMPLISALQASKVFGQPLVFGFLAQRQVYYLLSAHFIVTALDRQWIQLKDLERYLIRSLIILLFIFLFFYIFVNPAQFIDTEFVVLSMNKGYRYEFPDSCIYVLFLYSIFQVWHERKKIWWFSVALCSIYIVVYLLDRTQMIAIIGTIGLYVFLNFKVTRIIKLLIGSIAVLILIVGLTSVIAPNFFAKNIKLYISAYETITGVKVTESSANIRFLESKIAMEGFVEHKVLGVGFLSGRWNDGFRMVNRYFYPTDVGLLGNLYVYGILGTLVFYIPFILAFKYRKTDKKNKDVLLLVSQYFFIFLFVDMFTAATNQKYFGVVAVFFGLIYYYKYRIKENQTLSKSINE